MNTKCYFLLLALLLSPVSLYCQNNRLMTVDSIRSRFIRQVQLFPQEKIYVQTDKPEYIAGDTIWFKAYLTDAVVHLPSEHSHFAYIELINPLDKLERRLKLRIAPNQSYGQIDISDSIPEGNYVLRAYTGTMFGMDEQSFFHKNIYIHTPLSSHIKDSISFQFSENKVSVSICLRKRKEEKNILTKALKVQVNDKPSKTLKTDGDGWADFTFSLPDNSLKRVLYIEYDEGNYYFSKYIPIPFPKEDYVLSFFPEGGNLVEGKPCKIAFKAIKNNGLADNVKGKIVDNTGTTVIPSFESLYKGMGHFTLTPKAGKTYYALVRNDKGIERKVELPAAAKGVSSLSATVNKNRFRLSINHSVDKQAPDTLFLIVHSRGVVAYAEPWSPSVRYIDLKQEDFPSGVLQALLLDKNVNPLSERLLFCTNENDQAALSFKPDKESFKAREHLSVDLRLSDKDDTPLEGNFSVSVTNNEVAIDTTSNILTSLLLTSDLKGYIEGPAFYFEKDNPLAIEALDNLMLTQGWRRYNIPQIIKGNLAESPGFVELGQEISGVVKGLVRTKGISKAKVNIISMTNPYFNEVATDENGGFAFTGLNFPDNTEFVIQAHSAKGSDRIKLVTNGDEFPPVESGYVHIPIVKQDAAEPKEEMLYRAGEEFINGIRLIRLKEIEISAMRIKEKEEQPDAFQRIADKSYDTKWFKEHLVSSLVDVLYHTAGVYVDAANRRVIIRAPSSIDGESLAAFAIDGVIIDFDDRDGNGIPYVLSTLNIDDIERVDIFKTGSSVIWGSRGGSGVISVTTKKGIPINLTNQFNINRIRPLGYFVPAEFYSPVYKAEQQQTSGLPDYRTTLFWKPNIDTNKNGAASFDFYASDKPTTYTVVIEGITHDGHIIYKRAQIKNMQ